MFLKLVRVRVVRRGEETADGGEEDTEDSRVRKDELLKARTKVQLALAHKLECEASVLEDIGSYIKELASEAEARAFIAQADRSLREAIVRGLLSEKGSDGKLLVVAEKKSELEKMIARNRDYATKTSDRRERQQPRNGRPSYSRPRNPPPDPKKEKEVRAAEAAATPSFNHPHLGRNVHTDDVVETPG